jgi:hypothetical protein
MEIEADLIWPTFHEIEIIYSELQVIKKKNSQILIQLAS